MTEQASSLVASQSELVEQTAQPYLLFELGHERYAVELPRVQYIQRWQTLTPLPTTPKYLVGVLPFRAAMIPVVDLRIRFGMTSRPYSGTTVIIVVSVLAESQDKYIGMIVDTVLDTCNITAQAIKASPDFGPQIDTSYLSGLVAIDSEMVMLINVDGLIIEALA